MHEFRSGPPNRLASDRAFTLLEVLLVLSIIVAVTAIAIPNVRRGLSDQKLKQAAMTVRSHWGKARIAAMKAGRTHVFRYTLQGRKFVITAQPDPEMMLSETDSNSGAMPSPVPGFGQATSTPGVAGASVVNDRPIEYLPNQVFFLGANVQLDQRSTAEFDMLPDVRVMPVTGFERPVAEEDGMGDVDNWGVPIFFYPDGTSSTATMVLVDDRQRAITMQLRGLTAAVRVGNVQPLASLDRLPMQGTSP